MSHWPTALLIQRSVGQNHQIPLWNPYFGGGQPLGADPLAALFYPPTHLMHFLPLRDYYLVLMLGHLIFAGFGVVLFARYKLGLSHLSAFVAAMSFMATPRLLAHLGAGHLTMIQAIAWYPWLVLTCWMTVYELRRWGWLFAVCIAMMLLAGHPQMAYYGLLMSVMLASWLLVKRWRLEGRRAFVVAVIGLGIAGIVALMIAAIHLIPLLEFTSLSTRQGSVHSGDIYPLDKFFLAFVGWQRPSWEGVATPGVVVLVLALFAMIAAWRKVWPLCLGIGMQIGLCVGNAFLFYPVLVHILPGMDRFRGIIRMWFVGLLLFALLAGFGTEVIQRYCVRRLKWGGSFVPGVLIALILAFSLLIVDRDYVRSGDVSVFVAPSTVVNTASELGGSARIYSLQMDIPQLQAVQSQMQLADGWNPLLLKAYVLYMQTAGDYYYDGYRLTVPAYDSSEVQPNARLLGLSHVSLVLSRRPLTDPLFVKVAEANGILFYKNMADAGQAYLVNPGNLDTLPELEAIQQLDVKVHSTISSPENMSFDFVVNKEAYFVIGGAIAYPGWKVILDGQPVAMQQIADVLPAIKVGSGSHHIDYMYEPFSVYLGGIISLGGLITILLWSIIGQFYSKMRVLKMRFF